MSNGKTIGLIKALGGSAGSTGGTTNAVQYTPQELTEEQQMQARANIAAVNSWEELGEKTEVKVLIPETTVAAENYDTVTIETGSNEELVEGREYTLVFNGVEYKTKVVRAYEEGEYGVVEDAGLMIGNPAKVDANANEDNGLPMVRIIPLEVGGKIGWRIEPSDRTVEYTVALSRVASTYYPIPTEFIVGSDVTPSDEGKMFCLDVEGNVRLDSMSFAFKLIGNSQNGYRLDNSVKYEDIVKAYEQGKNIYLIEGSNSARVLLNNVDGGYFRFLRISLNNKVEIFSIQPGGSVAYNSATFAEETT